VRSSLLTLALVIVVAAAALLTGCGGGNADQKANDAYASGVCTAIGSWLTKVKSLDSIPPLGGIRKEKALIDAKLNYFQTASRQFVSQIKAVPAPNTSEGRAAKTKIDQLVTAAQAESASAKTVASTFNASPTYSQLGSAFSALLPGLQSLGPTAQSTLTSLQSTGGSLASAFKSEPTCKQLG
jgi:hypothetical protein